MDRFGDNVMCARLPFDTWRHRHDDCKVAIVERAHHAHVECDDALLLLCQVWGFLLAQAPRLLSKKLDGLGVYSQGIRYRVT